MIVHAYPKPLSHEEQIALCARAQTGDKAARDRLIVTTMRFVARRAFVFARKHCLPDSTAFEGEGVLGLIAAIERFDPAKGCRFITYAQHWVDNFVRSACLRDRGAPESALHRTALLTPYVAAVESGASHEDAVRAAAEAKNIGPKTATGVINALIHKNVSLDTPTSEGNKALLDTLTDEDDDPFEKVARAERCAHIRAVIGLVRLDLDARECMILDGRLLATDPITLDTIAVRLGLSRERVRQIELIVRKKLREGFEGSYALGRRRKARRRRRSIVDLVAA